MEHKVPHLLELKDEIHQTTRQISYSMTRQNNVHNSKIGINKTSPDILYEIFALAVYSSSKPGTTALSISHVCHHWREFALGWPVLWAFVACDYKPFILDLFIKRSQNAPLTLACGRDSQFGLIFDQEPSTSYFISQANSILSRSCSLIINTSYFNFARLNQVIQNSKCPPLRLQHLYIRTFSDQIPPVEGGVAKPPPLACLIDNSCLRVIQLEGSDLPEFQLPHNKSLTHLTLKYINPPPLSQFLAFLSNCPSLKVFELELQDRDQHRVETIFDVTTSMDPPIDKLSFVNLTRLGLGARGISSLDFIQQFSEFIQILGTLSQFELCYITPRGFSSVPITPRNEVLLPVFFQIFEAVRPGLFPSSSDYQYLSMDLQQFSSHRNYLKIYGDNSASCHRESDNSCPLVIDFENLHIGWHPPIRGLVKTMPQIQHLKLSRDAWLILTSWPNIHDAFPCLHTLEFTQSNTFVLESLPEDLRIKKLILGESCEVSSEVLLHVLVRMGVEVLEATRFGIWDSESMTPERRAEITSAFRERGYDGPRASEPVHEDEPDDELWYQ